MEMHQIRYFLTLCETLNFTRAAERCHVTQPALTRAIKRLEEEFGGPLFRRERNNTHLTDLGRLLQPQMAAIMSRTDAAREAAKGFIDLDRAPLSLGVMCTIGPLRFIGFLNHFRASNPGIAITLIEAAPRRLSELLLEGQIDIAVMSQPEPFHERLRADPLYRERFVVAFALGHRFNLQDHVRLKDVNGEPYLERINCEYGAYIDRLCDDGGVKLHIEYQSEREDWIQTMVAAGLGVSFMPEFTAIVPGLFTRPVIDPPIVRNVSLVHIAGRRFSPATGAFVQAVRRHAWTGTS